MQNKRLFFLIIFLLLIVFCNTQEIQFNKVDQNTKLNEGPYVFWGDGDATIKYILNDNVVTQDIAVSGEGIFSFKLEGLEGNFEIASFQPEIYPSSFSDISKFFVISDIHGQFDRMVELLKNNRIIDANLDWAWGNGHLIILGDVFDRGDKVTECLWLIHKLEMQANDWSGKVHYLLGNHEIMVLQNELQYVNEKYKKTAELMNMSLGEIYSPNSEFGRWLRTKHTIIKLNDVLFVHAGIHPKLSYYNYNYQAVNNSIRNNIDSTKDKIKYNELLNFLFGNDGPLWYRGYFMDTKTSHQIKQDELLHLLGEMGVNKIVVGHTIQDFINPFFKDNVIPVDTNIQTGNKGEALLYENGIYYRVKANTDREQLIFK
ncbi:MAG: metallophosphoesterase [Candidatus Cloacimonetes bacterium]|nr:metallophosphoesterase [Candidatus Cloacimonadota bacterium]